MSIGIVPIKDGYILILETSDLENLVDIIDTHMSTKYPDTNRKEEKDFLMKRFADKAFTFLERKNPPL